VGICLNYNSENTNNTEDVNMNKIPVMLGVMAMLMTACGGGTVSQSTGASNQDSPAAEGAQLFADSTLGGLAGCSACHSVTSGGFGTGPSLAQIGLTAGERVPGLSAEEYLRQSILDPNAYLVDDYTRGLMPPGYGDNLTEDEIDSLVAYLLTLK
jgi:mono/diheme cytochrome c family protein